MINVRLNVAKLPAIDIDSGVTDQFHVIIVMLIQLMMLLSWLTISTSGSDLDDN